ncbi:UNKNOWN [Stylonychia lemnae]|uniref:Uncharacterized protein n=1 Tax=Stylonychia lemnae TaxID=5949 RepID=A0A078AN72_STYLE|nr:UNKNOWN [Stylonychia lemnae]|eukprot:CDW82363.1 UNKNOWN [Stylonychia lemnae]
MFYYIFGYLAVTFGYIVVYYLYSWPDRRWITSQQKVQNHFQWVESERLRCMVVFVYFYVCQAWLRTFIQDIMGPLYFSHIFFNIQRFGSLAPYIFVIFYDIFNQLLEFSKSLIILAGFYHFCKVESIRCTKTSSNSDQTLNQINPLNNSAFQKDEESSSLIQRQASVFEREQSTIRQTA